MSMSLHLIHLLISALEYWDSHLCCRNFVYEWKIFAYQKSLQLFLLDNIYYYIPNNQVYLQQGKWEIKITSSWKSINHYSKPAFPLLPRWSWMSNLNSPHTNICTLKECSCCQTLGIIINTKGMVHGATGLYAWERGDIEEAFSSRVFEFMLLWHHWFHDSFVTERGPISKNGL